ncbi:LysR family transcriptional regulator [Eikenella longinqua]|uniref:LysR family transcriptional regulator n=1 Tax=Eikenella longinqua TaxID=1795827 RepID=A0A1A9S395_9NEIS|nr:LysR substrate-binding domain-containing protein [Eikenella longinqua]OAM31258.1 LysR family transcriptional regulator [Eikenella longinqua]
MKIAFLNALRAFEAACRHRSFSAAAQELNVTPAAVGQLVKSLEDYLGRPLFARQSGGRTRLVPSDSALDALPDIQAGFGRLSQGWQKLQAQHNHRLAVTASPAFAAKWLLPRLERFQAACPDIDLFLNTSPRYTDFLAEHIDIDIRYGRGGWTDVAAEKWCGETVFPVCSPAFAAAHDIRRPADLLALPLIHDDTLPPDSGFADWADWFSSGLPQPAAKGLHINNSAAVLQAAADGAGIALARSILAADDLKAGRLVRLFPEISVPSPLAYYLVYRAESCNLPQVRAFREWLRGEAGGAAE